MLGMLRLLAASLFLAGFLRALLAGALWFCLGLGFRGLFRSRLLGRSAALGGACGLLAFLTANGALGTRNVTVAVDEVDVVRVHLDSAVSDLFGTSLGNSRLL